MSSSSRESQATKGLFAGSDCIQVESKVVLPKPAGAEMSVRGYFKLAWSKLVRRGREISVPDATGTKNLVARSWVWMSIDVFIVASSACKKRSVALLLPCDRSLFCQCLLLQYYTKGSKLICPMRSVEIGGNSETEEQTWAHPHQLVQQPLGGWVSILLWPRKSVRNHTRSNI